MKTRVLPEATRRNSMIFTYAFHTFFIEMSRLVTATFDGDIDSFFILAAIANASVAHVMSDPAKARKYASIHRRIEEDYRFIKLLPLSEITGLPRTTIRRKAARLIDMGYVEHVEGAGYRVVKGSMVNCPQMRTIMQAQLRLVPRLFNVMLQGRLIEVTDPAAADGRKAAAGRAGGRGRMVSA